MALSALQAKKYRSRFAWVFAVSCVVLLISSLFFVVPAEDPGPPSTEPLPEAQPAIGLALIISVASLLTSVTSLAGFFITTGIALRKEKREQQHSDIDLERKKLEIEKSRLELESRGQEPPAGTDNENDVA
jgi:hypothetical protein